MEFDFKLPGLGRPESSRPKRVAEAIKNELSVLLLQKISDPRLSGVLISRVVVTPERLANRLPLRVQNRLLQCHIYVGFHESFHCTRQ